MIRSLRPGEPIPDAPYRRYTNKYGYIRARWKVAPGLYVEVYEHRIDWTTRTVHVAPQVHHINGIRDDNRPENLVPVTTQEHGDHHRDFDRAEARRLYESGLTTVAVGRILNVHPATLSRALRADGVTMRNTNYDRMARVPHEVVRAEAAKVASATQLARRLGLGVQQVRRLMREAGVPSYPVGRPRQELPFWTERRAS